MLALTQHVNTEGEEVVLLVAGKVIGVIGVSQIAGDKARITYDIDRTVTLRRKEILTDAERAALGEWMDSKSSAPPSRSGN